MKSVVWRNIFLVVVRGEDGQILKDWCGSGPYLEDPMEMEPEACEALGVASDDDSHRHEKTESEKHEDAMSLPRRKEEEE